MRKCVDISQNVYIGESIPAEKLKKIRKRLLYKPENAYVYVITISPNPEALLEIYDTKQLRARYYKRYPRFVVGIAGSYGEACELVGRISLDCLNKRGDCNLKEFLLC